MQTDYQYNIGNLTYVDIQDYLKKKDIIMVPIASLEQHSYHCPLFTDMITAREVTYRAALQAEVLYTPESWIGYSPHHMGPPGLGLGTITVRAETFRNLYYDIARSLIHHGFNKIVFVTGHASNMKIIDPLLRKIKYETNALVCVYKPYAENYFGMIADILECPPEETPGWHSSELETSQDLAWNEKYVRMDRANFTKAHIPEFLPKSFEKKDGMPDVEFEGFKYFTFPMDHHEFIETGVIGNPLRATKEKGEEAFRRLSEHVARGVLELQKVPVTVHTREFIDRVV